MLKRLTVRLRASKHQEPHNHSTVLNENYNCCSNSRGFHKAPIIIAYKISTAIPDYYQNAVACRKCIERFAPHGNFTFDFFYKSISELETNQKYDKVEMFADITNDIPFAHVSKSCHGYGRCPRIFNWDDSTLKDERKILNI
uniref:AlNc14C164G7839 protein n=1 Tax=Albugo laibachii Nc14 TaxID=890382 RepID=F0WN03_9STRA|nr:AlNc14C164G7839 [Albugo laibachii Nc14]|eukprot:CCA22690.1 AlNc14C164G7839 [Albugo laibachii Nc14]